MGQTPSQKSPDTSTPPAAIVQTRLQRHAMEIREIVSMTYDRFLVLLEELNTITRSFQDVDGKQLVFRVQDGSDTTIFWKGTIRICCYKVDHGSGMTYSARILNLKQFMHLFYEIKQQARLATIETSGANNSNLCASMIMNEYMQGVSVEREECCICMDRKSEISLRCSHTFCEQCIDEWNVNSKTCPICRAKVESVDDTWVLTEKPDTDEMVYETRGYLMGLADRTGTPADALDSDD